MQGRGVVGPATPGRGGGMAQSDTVEMPFGGGVVAGVRGVLRLRLIPASRDESLLRMSDIKMLYRRMAR